MNLATSCLGFPLSPFPNPAVHSQSTRMALTSPRDESTGQAQVMTMFAASPSSDTAAVVLFTGHRLKMVRIDAHLDHAEMVQIQTVRHRSLVQFVDVSVSDVGPVVVDVVAAVSRVTRWPLPDPASVLLLDDERSPSGCSFYGCSCCGNSTVMPLAHPPPETARTTITYGAMDAFGHRSSVPDDSPSEAS